MYYDTVAGVVVVQFRDWGKETGLHGPPHEDGQPPGTDQREGPGTGGHDERHHA